MIALGTARSKLRLVLRTYLHRLPVFPVKPQDSLVREACGLLWQEISDAGVEDLAVLIRRNLRSIGGSGSKDIAARGSNTRCCHGTLTVLT